MKNLLNLDINPQSSVGMTLNLLNKFDDFISNVKKAECPPNCHSCCNDYFFITQSEFHTILVYLIEEKRLNHNQIFSLIKKAKTQLSELKRVYPQEYLHITNTHQSPYDVINPVAHLLRLETSCPFLDNKNGCIIYKIRPFICRKFGSVLDSRYEENYCCSKVKYNDCVDFADSDISDDTNNLIFFGHILDRPFPICYWMGDILPFWNEQNRLFIEAYYKVPYNLFLSLMNN